MTNERAIAMLEYIRHVGNGENEYRNDACSIALDMAIQALKQEEEQEDTFEDVLEKIKSKIKDWQTDIHDNEYDAKSHDFVFEQIYEIIDERKAEVRIRYEDSN